MEFYPLLTARQCASHRRVGMVVAAAVLRPLNHRRPIRGFRNDFEQALILGGVGVVFEASLPPELEAVVKRLEERHR